MKLTNFAVLDPHCSWHSIEQITLPYSIKSKFNLVSLGDGHFNGERYADIISQITHYSLYDDLSSEDVKNIYQDLEGTGYDKLRSFFQICVENNLGLVASISP